MWGILSHPDTKLVADPGTNYTAKLSFGPPFSNTIVVSFKNGMEDLELICATPLDFDTWHEGLIVLSCDVIVDEDNVPHNLNSDSPLDTAAARQRRAGAEREEAAAAGRSPEKSFLPRKDNSGVVPEDVMKSMERHFTFHDADTRDAAVGGNRDEEEEESEGSEESEESVGEDWVQHWGRFRYAFCSEVAKSL